MPAPATSSRHLYTGHRQGHEQAAPWLRTRPAGRAAVPGPRTDPGFDANAISYDASAVVHTRSSSRRSPDPLIAGLLRSRFPPRLLTGMTLRWFGISACTANPEGQPPSLAQHGWCWRPSTSSSLSFQDTRRCRECHPWPATSTLTPGGESPWDHAGSGDAGPPGWRPCQRLSRALTGGARVRHHPGQHTCASGVGLSRARAVRRVVDQGNCMALRRAVHTQRRIAPVLRYEDPACRKAMPWRGASLRTQTRE